MDKVRLLQVEAELIQESIDSVKAEEQINSVKEADSEIVIKAVELEIPKIQAAA
jgi:hypothetical protein